MSTRTHFSPDDARRSRHDRGKIALAHSNEFPDHYMRLEQMEEQDQAQAATRLMLLEHWVT